MYNPKVSVCIPAYKQPELLRRTIKSVLVQDFEDYEIIITDDSPDDSVKELVLEQFTDKRIKYHKNTEKMGSPENWNEAVRLAAGKYIKILHHDDWFSDKDSLSEFVKMLDDNLEADFAFCSSFAYGEDNQLKFVHSPNDEQLKKLSHSPNYLFHGNCIGSPSATIYRNKFDLIFDYKLKWVVDIDFYIRILMKNSKFTFTKRPLICITTGSSLQVTHECIGNKEVEIFEWLYLYNKIKKRTIPSPRHLRFFWSLFRTYKIDSIQKLIAIYKNPPTEITLIIHLARFINLLIKRVG